jgi:predicted transcriptional regulator
MQNNSKQKHLWFVSIYEDELSKCPKSGQLAVYIAIKSFTANGKREIPLSYRDISSRSPVHKSQVPAIVKQLIEFGLIEITGKKGKLGGLVPVYKLSNNWTVKCPDSGQLESLSVQFSDLSVQSVASKLPQYKKYKESKKEIPLSSYQKNVREIPVVAKTSKNSLTPCTQNELLALALKHHISLDSVKRKHQIILNKIEAKEIGKNKTVYYTLENWLMGDLNKGYLQPLSEDDYLYLKCTEGGSA